MNSTLNEANSDPLEDQYPPPTDEENRTLRKVPANVPLVSFSLCLVEFAERASYYGARTVFANFIEFPLPKGQSHLSLLLTPLSQIYLITLKANF